MRGGLRATARDDILHPPKPVKKKKLLAQPPLPPLGQPLRASFLANFFTNWYFLTGKRRWKDYEDKDFVGTKL